MACPSVSAATKSTIARPHPAYLLRTPSAKKDVWEDMKVVLSLLAE
jgi:uracil-DNA glycosylase